MRIKYKRIFIPFLLFLFFACASKKVNYELPSAGTTSTPTWVETPREVRDSIFIVIHLPEAQTINMDKSVQLAQSELHTLLVSEIEVIIRDYWEQKNIDYSDADKFELLSQLPVTLEQIMNHVEVTDGWERQGEVSILCALDYEEVADVLMQSMEIEDRSFLPYLKLRMDDLAERNR